MLDAEWESVTAFVDEAIQHFSAADRSGKRVLDFGCGSGGLVERLAARGYEIEGCDIKPYWDTTARSPAASG